MTEPIYAVVVAEHDGWDPRDLTTFDLADFLTSHTGRTGVPEQAQPRKAARRAKRA